MSGHLRGPIRQLLRYRGRNQSRRLRLATLVLNPTPRVTETSPKGEHYSLAAFAGADPVAHFAEMKMELEVSAHEIVRLKDLGGVAKVALEAGLNDDARLYPDKALALADEPRYRNAPVFSPESSFRGDAVFLGNLVLGRLPLLRDDMDAAEKYLLLSGQINNGELTV